METSLFYPPFFIAFSLFSLPIRDGNELEGELERYMELNFLAYL